MLTCIIVFTAWVLSDLLLDDRPRPERVNRED